MSSSVVVGELGPHYRTNFSSIVTYVRLSERDTRHPCFIRAADDAYVGRLTQCTQRLNSFDVHTFFVAIGLGDLMPNSNPNEALNPNRRQAAIAAYSHPFKLAYNPMTLAAFIDIRIQFVPKIDVIG